MRCTGFMPGKGTIIGHCATNDEETPGQEEDIVSCFCRLGEGIWYGSERSDEVGHEEVSLGRKKGTYVESGPTHFDDFRNFFSELGDFRSSYHILPSHIVYSELVYHWATSQSRLTWRVHFVSWTLQNFKPKRHKRSKRCTHMPEQF